MVHCVDVSISRVAAKVLISSFGDSSASNVVPVVHFCRVLAVISKMNV